MNSAIIIEQINSAYPQAKVTVDGEGCNFSVSINDQTLNSMSKVKAQQQIYKLFKVQIQSGEIHALTINLD